MPGGEYSKRGSFDDSKRRHDRQSLLILRAYRVRTVALNNKGVLRTKCTAVDVYAEEWDPINPRYGIYTH